jgi:hypothetical protein
VDWWYTVNNYAAMIPQSPALAAFFATNGPNPDTMGYDMVSQLQQSPTPVSLYPSSVVN